MRTFAGVAIDAVPDETTVLKFRHILETHHLPKQLFDRVNTYLADHVFIVKQCTLVDARIIQATASTKNKNGKSLRKNTAQLYSLFISVNLYRVVRRQLTGYSCGALGKAKNNELIRLSLSC